MIWTGIGCLTLFINSVIWDGNTTNWAPVWCDISTSLIEFNWEAFADLHGNSGEADGWTAGGHTCRVTVYQSTAVQDRTSAECDNDKG